MIKTIKLTPKEVRAYEFFSGFKTTGDVEIVYDDAAWKLYELLLLKSVLLS